MSNFKIRSISIADRDRVKQFIVERWGAEVVVVHGTIYKPSDFPGFIALDEKDDKWLGLITYHIVEDQCEIITLDSLCPSAGIGTTLLEAVKKAAIGNTCKRLWLITTNDNLNALRFYQKRGFVLVAIHRNAVNKARKLKAEIPKIGEEGIPLRDEIELEMLLRDGAGENGF